jgi:O-antigen ligase/tetratricopeptide (TPR) repeat protein
VEPKGEFVLFAGVAVLLGLWGGRMLLEGRLSWAKCPVALCLAALTLYGVWQLAPLPPRLLGGVAPGTARMYAQLLPPQAEVLPPGGGGEAPAPPAGSTISLCPGRTRAQLIRLLAVFLLFAVVRNNTASPAALRRLSIAVTINGVLLCLLALAQSFTSPPGTVYWIYPSPGAVFGPFICRNHFAFYMNVCVGLGVGLLLGCRNPAPGGAPEGRDWLRSPLNLLHDPRALWTSAALALMLSSVAFCLSRGGLLALLGASVVCLAVALRRYARLPQLGMALLPLALALALLTWFGWERVEARVATLGEGKALRESRLLLWSRTLPLASQFPVWGTGYGTFPYVEPMSRSNPADESIYTNAENDYLEALVEGGLVRLALSVLAVGLVFRLGYRAVCRPQGHEGGGLALGALFGFSAVAIHSGGDFGLHVPAIAFLATVLCAHLCALGHTGGPAAGGPEPGAAGGPGAYRLRLGGLAPVAGAVLAVSGGLVLGHEGWRAYRVEWLRHEASPPSRTSPDRGSSLASLEAAARLAPESAGLQVELAHVHVDRFEERAGQLQRKEALAGAAQAVSDLVAAGLVPSGAPPGLVLAPSWVLTAEARRERGQGAEGELVRQHLVPALRYFLRARDLCPLLPEPHRRLADYGDRLTRADTRAAYLGRAALLAPHNPGLWCLLGGELLAEQPDRAWESWRRSLELSDRYFAPILQRSAKLLSPADLLDRVLPDKPDMLVAVALALPEAERRPFLERALALLDKGPGPLDAGGLRVKALAHDSLGQPGEAVAAYRAALAREPHREGWRYELAELLQREGRWREAQRELVTVLKGQPGHAEARALLTAVERQLARAGATTTGPGGRPK